MKWLSIIDYVSAILLILSVWNVQKNKNWWIVYFIGTIGFIIVNFHAHLVGMTVMGIILGITAVKNYFEKK